VRALLTLASVLLAFSSLSTLAAGGTVTVQVGSNSTTRGACGALQSDGKILSAGATGNPGLDSLAVRLTSAGALDASFSGDGIAAVAAASRGDDLMNACLVQADGKFVSAGWMNDRNDVKFVVMRFNSNGSLDTKFNKTGIASASLGSGAEKANAVAQLPDGRLVAAGFLQTTNPDQVALAAFTTAGKLDASFGSGGWATTQFGTGDAMANAMAVQSDGKIVIAGQVTAGSVYLNDIIVARYNANGSLDASFGSGGKVITDLSDNDKAFVVKIQSDGKILVGGHSQVGNFLVWTLVRYNSDGSLDSGFGSGGVEVINPSLYGGFITGLALQSDGQILISGNYQADGSPDHELGIARLNPDGSFDSSFGGGAIVTHMVAGYTEPLGLEVQADGKAVVFGRAEQDYTKYMMFVRFEADGSLDAGF